ncbi:MAG: ATP-binding cassette domain-containing protein [Acidimicrobiia bacterium]|nr:ATP-binding cassette domain-containing protein [Acidimicrobiia bacterium]
MGTPVVDLRSVSVQFATTTALDALTVAIDHGERVAVLGPSGAGKSTLLGLIAGSIAPTTGQVRVLGRELVDGEPAPRRHRAAIGLITQHLDLVLPLRVHHNVNAGALGTMSTFRSLWSLLTARDRIASLDALDAVGLADRADERTDALSGGERQRVAVARLLRQRPELVLADEPTSSVDPRLSDEIMGLLTSRERPWTAVVTAHDPDLALRHTSRAIGVRNGAIEFDELPDAVTDRQIADLYRQAT